MNVEWLGSLLTIRGLFGAGLISVVTIMAVIDCRKMSLPDSLNLALVVIGVGQSLAVGKPGPIEAGFGAVFAFGLLWSAAKLFQRCRGVEGLGFGDLKFSAAAGLWIGWELVAPMLTIASCSALLFFALRSWRLKRVETEAPLPFGPFLGLGTAVCWLLAATQQSSVPAVS